MALDPCNNFTGNGLWVRAASRRRRAGHPCPLGPARSRNGRPRPRPPQRADNRPTLWVQPPPSGASRAREQRRVERSDGIASTHTAPRTPDSGSDISSFYRTAIARGGQVAGIKNQAVLFCCSVTEPQQGPGALTFPPDTQTAPTLARFRAKTSKLVAACAVPGTESAKNRFWVSQGAPASFGVRSRESARSQLAS